jgi:hypothetical protein
MAMNAPIRNVEEWLNQETENQLWYLFAGAIGEANSDRPAM